MSAGVVVTIDGVDRSAYLGANSWRWASRLEERATCDFELIVKGPTPYYRPLVGEPVIVTLNGTRIFGGMIDNVDEDEPVKGAGVFYTVRCKDYAAILDRFLVARKFDGVPAGDMVTVLVRDYVNAAEGMTTTGVQPGITLGKVVFGYRKASDCIRELATLCGFSWYVDEFKDVKFFERATYYAPFSIVDGSNNYLSLSIKRSGEKYRNVQYIRGGLGVTNSRQESFKGDGSRQSFPLTFPVAGSPAAKPVITLNTGGGPAAQTVGIRNLDDPTAYQWYYEARDKTISQRDTDAAIASTDILAVTYVGLFPTLALRQDGAKVAERSSIEGGSGVYQAIETDRSIESEDFAEDKALALIRKYGDIPTELRFSTDEAGLRAGQILTVDLPTRGDDLSAKEFLIESVTARDLEGLHVRYEVIAASGEHLGGWASWFRKLAAAGQDFTLQEGEVIDQLSQHFEGIKFTETYSQAVALKAAAVDLYSGWPWNASGSWWGKSYWGNLPV